MTAPCDARCCDHAEVPLLDEDIGRIATGTGRTVTGFVDEAEDWRVLKGTGLDGCVFRGQVQVAGRRVLGCTIHTLRPAACRTYPFVLRTGAEGARLVRDALCPFADRFPDPPPGTAGQLLALERQLDEERAERRRIDGR